MTNTDGGNYGVKDNSGHGKGSILKDSKIGSVVTGAVVVVLLYAADALGQVDISPLPDFLEPLAGGAITTAVAWLTIKAAPRR
jgi:hypothetical protein